MQNRKRKQSKKMIVSTTPSRMSVYRGGRGFASDFMENIPIVGPIFANIGRKLLGIGIHPHKRRAHYRYIKQKKGGRLRRVHVRGHRVRRQAGRLLMYPTY